MDELNKLVTISEEGLNLVELSQAAERIGFKTLGASISYENLRTQKPLPLIAHWNNLHYVVVYKISRKKVYVSDPALGLVEYTRNDFLLGWNGRKDGGSDRGVVLILEPRSEFYQIPWESSKEKSRSLTFMSMTKGYSKFFGQALIGLVAIGAIQLVFPFLTQTLVDVGIKNQDFYYIQVILIAQLMLLLSITIVEFIRGWILLYVSTRINITIISDFLSKLMRLPFAFFQNHSVGDLLQRTYDHNRIENFLTGTTIGLLYSAVNLCIFGLVLAYFHTSIFIVFLMGSLCYVFWIVLFMRMRRKLDNERFTQLAKNQGSIMQIINGIQEIKLQNNQLNRRWEWERIQAKLFKLNMKNLSLNQIQQAGSFILNEGRNVFITFLAASSVITGEISLGTMLAVQYIVGQLSSPLNQLIGSVHAAQDAKISLDRLEEIHKVKEEESSSLIRDFDIDNPIELVKVCHKYANSDPALDDVSMTIELGKVTAIVGNSGSGKTTLVKMLLKLYEPSSGAIKIGERNIAEISAVEWRKNCAVVMQDGYIFSDTILNNIIISRENYDEQRLKEAIKIANAYEFITSSPSGLETLIGENGVGLSQGQKQRILIARAVYRNTKFIFLDEATNALDSNNEKIIWDQLLEFFKDRTVLVIAHRLSTVVSAHRIFVLNKGKIVESGTHNSLIDSGGEYFKLVKNQLSLGE